MSDLLPFEPLRVTAICYNYGKGENLQNQLVNACKV